MAGQGMNFNSTHADNLLDNAELLINSVREQIKGDNSCT